MSGPNFNEPIEETFSEWHNPLDVEQCVDVRIGDSPRPTRYRIPPGESRPIPSRYDNVVQRVHNGVIIGGQAPQLVKRGSSAVLDDALNTELLKKKEAEAKLAAAKLQEEQGQKAAMLAAAEASDAQRKLEKQAEAASDRPVEREAPTERALPPEKKRG